MYRTALPTRDAQARALSYLTNQAYRIETEVYAIEYQDIQYPGLVPVDTTGPEWLPGVTYFSSDAVGRASWFHAKADDVSHADITREKFEETVSMAAIGYDYDLEELGIAGQFGIPLSADKAAAARRAAEEFIDRVAILGDSTKNYTGLVNNASVTAGSATANGNQNGATNSTLWLNKTADQILADVNTALTGMFTTSLGSELADTLLLPYTQLQSITSRRIDTVNQTTIFMWLQQANVYTMQTGRPLTIRGVWGLETAGSGVTARLVAYRKDPSVLRMYIPMPFRFYPAWQQGPIRFEVPGIMRLSGVMVRRPVAMRYVDGI